MTTETKQNTNKSSPLSEAEFEALFRRLNLANTRRIYQQVAGQAEQESWSYCDFLARLLQEEVAHRMQTRLQRCTRNAHFPFFQTIEESISLRSRSFANHCWVPTWGQTSSPKATP
jgi:hypothetical protein